MKACSYCGRENDDVAGYCRECGTDLTLTPSPTAEGPPPIAAPRLFTPEELDNMFIFEEGFHRADWNLIGSWLMANVSALERQEAWNEAALYWVSLLRRDLGGGYQVWQSRQSILLADLPVETARWLLGYTDDTATTIQAHLKQVAWAGNLSKDAVLVFGDEEDYYQYLAYHLKEGVEPRSSGVCLHSGYTHVAIPWQNEANTANAVVHELTHDCLAHLHLPLWLNEGVAVILQKAIAPPAWHPGQSEQDALFSAAIQWRPPVMWHELAERHFAWWTEQNIQTFWAGTSFHEPGDSNELSYSLAQVLVTFLANQGDGFLVFLQRADPHDAGQTAAFDVLGVNLGDVAATFLGHGNWHPRRKAIQECWKDAGWSDPVPSLTRC